MSSTDEVEPAIALHIDDVKPDIIILNDAPDHGTSESELNSSTSSAGTPDSRRRRQRRRLRRKAGGSSKEPVIDVEMESEGVSSSDDNVDQVSAAQRRPVLDTAPWPARDLPSTHTIFERKSEDDHVLLLVSGSVAAIKLAPLVELLRTEHAKRGAIDAQLLDRVQERVLHIRCVLTESACHFINEQTTLDLLSAYGVFTYRDAHEYQLWGKRGDPVLHVELAKWANVMCIAPMSANTLARLTAGLCDNLVQCVLRATTDDTRVFYAPAMNTHMWQSPLTRSQMDTVDRELGYTQLAVVSKTLMCGEVGPGAMAEIDTIAGAIVQHLYAIRKQI